MTKEQFIKYMGIIHKRYDALETLYNVLRLGLLIKNLYHLEICLRSERNVLCLKNIEQYCVIIYRKTESNHKIVVLGKISPKARQNIDI